MVRSPSEATGGIFGTLPLGRMANFKTELEKTIKRIVKELYKLDLDPALEHPAQEAHGDYSTNAAMVLAKRLKAEPLDIANSLKEFLVAWLPSDLVTKVEVVSPGFINFWLKEKVLLQEVSEVIKKGEDYGRSDKGKGKTVVIDYSAPNIAKRFGIGHLRSTTIGQALYNLYGFLGYKTIGDNHLGDWGTQFGTLLYQVKNKKLNVKDLSIDDLEGLYVEFHQEAEKNPKLMDEARAWFKKLEEGDSEARRVWKTVVDVSMREFSRVYDLLGVKIDYAYGESFYEDKMPVVIAEVRKKGLSKKSVGAEIIEFSDLPPAILVKSDGGTTYFTRDLATIRFRVESWDPQIYIYEVGADQKLHFRQVFEAAKLLGWMKGRELIHVAHGLIRFEHGKMSTRRGQTVKLEDVLGEAIKKAQKIMDESKTHLRRGFGGQAGRGLSDKEKEEVARAVGIGAIKYFDLSHHPLSDIIFDWEKIFVLEGNSAPYLQYTCARAMSVLQKARTDKPLAVSRQPLASEELPLLRFIYRFPEVVEEAARTYSPNLVCSYLFELAQRFNSFYAKVPIIKAESKEMKQLRLALTAATGQIIKNGLTLLGIEVPKRL